MKNKINMIKFIVIFCALLFTALFINIKTTRIALLLAFKQEEEHNETKTLLLIMLLAVLFWSIYLVL
jgi:dipeptide/tripeptide permease